MTFQSAESTRVFLGKRREVSRVLQRLCKHRAFFSAVQHRPEALPTPFAKTASLARIFSALVALAALCLGSAHAQNAVTLAWNPVTNTTVTSYKLYQGTKSGSYTVSTNVGNVSQAKMTGLANGTQYYFAVSAVNSAGESPHSAEIAYTVPPLTNTVPTNSIPTNSVPTNSIPSLGPQWSTRDIGNVGLVGSATSSGGSYVVRGAGDLKGNADAFRFLFQPLNGDGQITAQVLSDSASVSNGLMGVMIRESLAPNARYAFMGLTSQGYPTLQQRKRTGAGENSITASSKPATLPNAWVRLVRKSGTFYGYQSADGTNWRLFNSSKIGMPTSAYIGLVVTSGNTNFLNTVTFTNLGGVQ